MQYRTWNKIGRDISLLGTGTMRLPLTDSGEIDEDVAVQMIRRSIDRGVNYVDTAWMYHDGKSEVVVGKALRDGYRQKVFLADKLPVWYARTTKGLVDIFETQLERCETDHFDMYLLHSVDAPVWKRALKLGALDFLEEMKSAGKIKYLGFSFHGEEEFFPEVVDAHDWDFCQIQLNYMDAAVQAGVKGLRYAGKKGLPVVIMEPLKGGKLTDNIPPVIAELWDSAPIRRTPAEWAFRWVADFPQVSTILSGMSAPQQLEENLRILDAAKPCTLTGQEHALIERVADLYNELIRYSCTACKYCMPCPEKINIPAVMEYYNEWFLYDRNPKTKEAYFMWLPEGRRASDCVSCGACEDVCPQKLPVTEVMKKAAAVFEDK